MEEWKYSSTER